MDVTKAHLSAGSAGDTPRELLLVVPPAIPIAMLFAIFVAERAGAYVNIHGLSGMAVVFGFYAAAIVALAIEIVAVPFALWALFKDPTIRSTRYIVATIFAASFLFCFPILWYITGGARV
jgi:hypothetical protein